MNTTEDQHDNGTERADDATNPSAAVAEPAAAKPEPAEPGDTPETTAPTATATVKARRPAARRPRRKHRGSAGLAGVGLSLRTPNDDVVHVAPAPVTEGLRYMVGRLRLLSAGDLPRRLGVISALPGEGVTSICRSLALLLAHDTGRRICIVDLNWGSPSPWPVEEDQGGGIAAVLRRESPLEDALRPTVTGHLWVLPAGVADPVERPILASSPQLEAVLAALETSFDHVIIDLPAIHATSEALPLAEHAGALAVVVRQGVTSEAQVKAAVEELHDLPVLGVILNRASSKVPRPLRRLVGV